MVQLQGRYSPTAQTMRDSSDDLYEVLGLSRSATEVEIRRAFKTLITKEHPDKGGNIDRFKAIKVAYDTLSNKEKREYYETTGKISRTPGEDFMDKFRGGSFGSHNVSSAQEKQNLAEAITISLKPQHSHSAGFEAWMRSRGDQGTQVYTADTMAEQFGVNKGSYEPVYLPKLNSYKVLVRIMYAPVDAADSYISATGGSYGGQTAPQPFVGGQHGIGVVAKLGPGTKGIEDGDWVVPLRSHMGTWQSMAVMKAADLVIVPKSCMPPEYAALSRQLCLAYCLLEQFGKLKPGDCVILNAATSTVGQAVVQLCSTLQLRAVAVVCDHGDFEKTVLWLKSLGASEVLKDKGTVKAELEKLKFFAKPKLALDAVGGPSAIRIADTLAEGGQLVIYGCLSGTSPIWPWQSWVFKGLQVQGFNYSAWMAKHAGQVPKMMMALGRLVSGHQLKLAVTEYDLATEFQEAVEHAEDRGTKSKALLCMAELSVPEEVE